VGANAVLLKSTTTTGAGVGIDRVQRAGIGGGGSELPAGGPLGEDANAADDRFGGEPEGALFG
jgi:hypothetical protein